VFPLQIVEMDRGPEPVEDQPGEREMAEMVGTELHFEAVCGDLLGGPHHPGVVDQQVDARVGRRWVDDAALGGLAEPT